MCNNKIKLKAFLSYWAKTMWRIYVLSSTVIVIIVWISLIVGYVKGEILYPIAQLALLCMMLILIFLSPIITILFVFFRFLKLLSDNALNDRLLIVLTSLLFIFPSNISEFDLPIFDNIIIVYIFHYGFAFVTTILLDKFSVLDKLRAAFKKRKNKVSRKHEI